ncbi:MAG: flagellar FlbD family protein [bacterium]|nr:flagellar FlbD family protein [bacterium]
MITLTRFNGSAVVVNAELIKLVESTPDTIITLIGGDKILVKETVAEVVERVMEYRRQVFKNLVFFRPEADT